MYRGSKPKNRNFNVCFFITNTALKKGGQVDCGLKCYKNEKIFHTSDGNPSNETADKKLEHTESATEKVDTLKILDFPVTKPIKIFEVILTLIRPVIHRLLLLMLKSGSVFLSKFPKPRLKSLPHQKLRHQCSTS